jgi:hypothetical protein
MALSAKIGVAQEGGTPTSALRAQERQPHGPRHPVDQDQDAYFKAREEALLVDPQFLAWLDQQDADSTGLC